MKILTCAICGDNTNTKLLYSETFDKKALTSKTFSARRVPDRIHYQLLQCQKCGLIFSSPIISQKLITQLYKESDFTYKEEAYFLADTYGNYLKRLLPEKGKEKLRLLDIGCGNGFFLEKAKSMGVGEVYGVEPGKASVVKANPRIKKQIRVDILHPGLFKKNYFDIICCFHTLDHIIDPNIFLQTVFTLLKKNGHILFVTHNTNGLSVKLFGEKSPIFDIEHIYLFNEKNLSKIFLKNGFTNTQVYNLKNTYPFSYWLQLLPMPRFLKNITTKIFLKTKIRSLPISFSAGNIAIIASKM